MKQQTSIRLFTSFIFLLFTGCPDNGVVPPDRPSFSLSVEEVVSTEALMKIEYALSDSITVFLKRNGQIIVNNLRMSKEFVFNDTLLQPKQNYTYVAIKIENGKAVDSTAPLQITTMDITGSNFTWETFTFGNTDYSEFYDVAIVNDTLIYVVGEIHTAETDRFDSLGNWVNPYNVAKWNGKKWELITLKWNCRLYYPNCGPDLMLFSPATAVFTFAPNDVWIASGSIHHFDGTKWTEEAGVEGVGNANKIWGDPSIGLWFVGGSGFIAHRSSNGSWQKIESGTTTHIQDVWGIINTTTKEEVYCAVTDFFEPKDRKILRVTNATDIDSVSWNIGRDVVSAWTYSGNKFYVCGDGLYERKNGIWKEIHLGVNFYTSEIRGNAPNDIFVVGSFGLIAHYNGMIWKWFSELYDGNVAYRSIAVQQNLVVAVGFGGGKGRIIIGKRN